MSLAATSKDTEKEVVRPYTPISEARQERKRQRKQCWVANTRLWAISKDEANTNHVVEVDNIDEDQCWFELLIKAYILRATLGAYMAALKIGDTIKLRGPK
ncbi:NADH-cytochrome b5 reductase, partial [Exophiala xenobiotica]